MADFIVGNDISEFQGILDWPTYIKNSNFVLIRSSQGNSYIDKEFGNNRQLARDNDIPRGFYHFANPDLGNSPHDEANFFISLIDGQPILGGEVLALDFEVDYSDAVNWCKDWLDIVSAHYNGIKPLIYLNQDIAQKYDWTPVIEAGYGLWIAAYTGDPTQNTFQGGAWQTAAIQQWTDAQTVPGISVPVDGDVFFGTIEEFKKYGSQPLILPTLPTPAPQEPEIPPNETTPTQEAPVVPVESKTPSEPTAPITPIRPTIPETVDPQTSTFIQEMLNWIEALFQKKNE